MSALARIETVLCMYVGAGTAQCCPCACGPWRAALLASCSVFLSFRGSRSVARLLAAPLAALTVWVLILVLLTSSVHACVSCVERGL